MCVFSSLAGCGAWAHAWPALGRCVSDVENARHYKGKAVDMHPLGGGIRGTTIVWFTIVVNHNIKTNKINK